MFVVSSMNDINMSVLIPMVLFFAAADTFFIPASISVVPRLFKKKNEISLVNSMDQSLRSVFNVVSPLIASAIMLTLGIQVVLIIDALTFAFSGLAECFLVFNESEKKVRKNGNILEDIVDGVKTILSDVRIRSLMINGALTHLFLFTFIEIGMISLLIVTFKSPEYHYGILQSVISVSAIIASAIAISYRKKRSVAVHINYGIIGMIVSVLLFLPLSFQPFFLNLLSSEPIYPLVYLSIGCFAMYLSFGYYVVFFLDPSINRWFQMLILDVSHHCL